MEAVPKSDIKFVIRFDISIKQTTWIGHKSGKSASRDNFIESSGIDVLVKYTTLKDCLMKMLVHFTCIILLSKAFDPIVFPLQF